MLDELLYGLGRRAASALRPRSAAPPGRARLEDHVGRLQVLASALCDRTMSISAAAEGPGGVTGNRIYLPTEMTWFEDAEHNRLAYVLRLVLGLVLQEQARRSGLSGPRRLSHNERIAATLLLFDHAKIEVLARFPGLAPVLHAALRRAPSEPGPIGEASLALAEGRGLSLTPSPTELRALTDRLERRCGRRLLRGPRLLPSPALFVLSGLVCNPPAGATVPQRPDATPTSAEALPNGTERPGASKEDVEVLTQESDPERENPVFHLFEKIETAEEYQGTQKSRDGSDELDEHGEALDELSLGHVIRTQQTSASLYRADLVLETADAPDGDPAAADGAVRYDEWDGRRRRYRRDHCVVRVETATTILAGPALREVTGNLRRRLRHPMQRLRVAFLRIAQAERLRSRQRDGIELDLDAFVAARGRVAAGGEMDPRIWWARRPRQRELAVLVLLDGSLSADSWVAGRRVLDVAREACFMLGEVLSRHECALSIAAFHSHTRHDCRYVQIQGFDETWERAKPRLFGLRPTGFTRIGPALRHATATLAGQRAQRRLLVVLSDGKATDYDHYEGRYGTADVRQAVRETGQRGIDCVALAIEKEARHYLPAMFGRNGFDVMPRPELLPERLGVLLSRFAEQR